MRNKRCFMCLALVMLSALIALAPVLAESLEDGEADIRFMENEWNYVEVSLDVSAGIPEDATARSLSIPSWTARTAMWVRT